MPHQILVNGVKLDPAACAKALLPMDTPLRCPECNSFQVGANEPRLSMVYDGEATTLVPRHQDRFCLECRHQWTVTIPPEIYSDPAFQRFSQRPDNLIAGRGR
jgi:hypothetical protein